MKTLEQFKIDAARAMLPEDGFTPEEIEAQAREWYEEAQAEAEREDAAFRAWERTSSVIRETARVAEAALRVQFRGSAGGSRYCWFQPQGAAPKKLRISDHWQKPGGGWNDGAGERNGDADVQIIVGPDSAIPSAHDIRRMVSAAIRYERVQTIDLTGPSAMTFGGFEF